MAKPQNIESVLQFLNDTVSIEDFLAAFEKVVKNIDDKHLENKAELAQIATTIAEKWKETNDRIKEKEDELENIQKKVLLDLSEKQKAFVELVRAKVDSIRVPEDGKPGEPGAPGKDADENYILNVLLARLDRLVQEKIPKQEKTKVYANDIIDLDERIKRVAPGSRGGGTSAIGVAQTFKYIAHTEQPVGDIDGINTVYRLKNTIWWVAGATLNGEQIAQLPNFTISGRTITFSTPIPADYSGKDWEIKYIGT